MKITASVEWAMPSPWTFSIPPIKRWVEKHIEGRRVIVDPFAGRSRYTTICNDLATSGIPSEEWILTVPEMDVLLFDPPYSPRQISEVYKSVGLPVGMKTTQSAVLYKRVLAGALPKVKLGGKVLRFGWQSGGLGPDFSMVDLMLVQHGGAHNDTICSAFIRNTPPSLVVSK